MRWGCEGLPRHECRGIKAAAKARRAVGYLLAVPVMAASLAWPGRQARAQGRPEPTYGRLQGDLTLVAGLGAVAAEPTRVLAAGLELRPLFLFRWLTGRETQRARVDLVVDSLGLELGAVFTQPAGTSFASQAGMQAALGLEVP